MAEEIQVPDAFPNQDKSKGQKVWLTPEGAIPRKPASAIETDLDRIRKKEVVDIYSRETGNNGEV